MSLQFQHAFIWFLWIYILKDTWFWVGGATSTLTVPASPNGLPADMVRSNLLKVRQPVGTKTLVIEDGGTSAQSGLVKSNQFLRDYCGWKDCVLCHQRDGNDTSVEVNVTKLALDMRECVKGVL